MPFYYQVQICREIFEEIIKVRRMYMYVKVTGAFVDVTINTTQIKICYFSTLVGYYAKLTALTKKYYCTPTQFGFMNMEGPLIGTTA